MTQSKSLSINKILELVGIYWRRLSNSNALAVSKSIICASAANSVIVDVSIRSSASAVARNFLQK